MNSGYLNARELLAKLSSSSICEDVVLASPTLRLHQARIEFLAVSHPQPHLPYPYGSGSDTTR